MEHIFNKGIFGNIICRTTLFLILFITGTASKPLWIWTKGCQVTKSTEFVNQTENTPYTCFHVCGENTLTIALQGNWCSCNPEPISIQPASYCEPCDGNKMAACGHVTKGYWSLYERANVQQLTDRKIDDKATGCVVYSFKSSSKKFSVENCSKKARSLCRNALSGKLVCSTNSKMWTTDACDTGNRNDKLVDTFKAFGRTLDQCIYKYMYWIGLFSVDRASSHNVAPLSSKSVISPSSIDISIRNILQTISSAGIILNVISPATISPTNISPIYIYPTSTLKDVSHTDVPPTNTSSTNSISANFSLTNISSTNPFPTSTFVDVSLTYISSTNISTSISPSSVSPACTSFTDVSATNISPNISLTDVPLSNISTDISFTRNNIFPTQISPAVFSTYDSLTNSLSSEIPSTLVFMTTRLRTSETFNTKTHVKPSSQKVFKTLKHKKIGGSSSKDIGSTTLKEMSRSDTVIGTPVSSARTESSDKDSMVALAVVGAVSAVAVLVIAMLAVYVRRSMKVIQMQQRRMTTMSDGPTMGSEETVFTDGDRSESIDDSFRDMPNTFSTAKRADLQVQGNWSLFSNRSRTVQDNEDEL